MDSRVTGFEIFLREVFFDGQRPPNIMYENVSDAEFDAMHIWFNIFNEAEREE
jgi:hypothetical protein